MLKQSVATVLSVLTGVPPNTGISSEYDLKDNPWVPPKDGRCVINELPTELLSYIFELGAVAQKEAHGHADDDDDEDDRSFDSLSHSSSGSSFFDRKLPFELLVSRICRQWREVATGLPVLWTTLTFENPLNNFEQQRVYLERAKGAPLDISIDCTFEEDEDPEEHDALNMDIGRSESRVYKEIKQVLEMIAPHISHWHSFEVMVSHYLLMQLVLETLASASEGAPLLEVLLLYHYEDGPDDMNTATFQPATLKVQDFVLFNNRAPKLAHVALWGVHLNWGKSTFLSGLHELELAYHAPDVRPSYQEFLSILKASPELVTLTLCESGPSGGPVEWLASVTNDSMDAGQSASNSDSPTTTYTLSSLRNLVLAYLPANYITQLLERLPMPSLTSLALDFDDDDSQKYDAFLEKLALPHPAGGANSRSLLSGLEALKLSGLRVRNRTTIFRAGLALKNLRQLNLDVDEVDVDWVEMLIEPQDFAPDVAGIEGYTLPPDLVLCPELTLFTVTGLYGDTIRALIEARKEAGHPLVELYVNEDDNLNEDDVKWIRENVEVFEYFQGSESGDGEDVFVDLDEDEWEEGFNGAGEFDYEDMEDVEDEMDDDEGEWTDED
ncbi:hypothetical protein BDW22DRAFT_1353385 [Trametopsis cervina]|nr:hypothetical protein BDW22DRAFT_1353385 [Trametopsis cervina]